MHSSLRVVQLEPSVVLKSRTVVGVPHDLSPHLGRDPAPRARLRDLQVADIDSDFMLFDLILGLTALLAGVGVLNGQLLAALERTKELGILKALGTSAGQIAGMV